ncbi:DUF2254 domain-containing protein [Cognatishimia sp. MH4019]|uniref:DUF2254 domain-containing protein n=1 Tax=Cognatishimia sp. MH4019 TaxID=2854030 RepID=UPI001CD356AA|nr:DUF2254 domain-containing protein [Cognatishimia sp. MH4019]
MISKTFFELRRISRILWVRIALILILSVIAALSAELFDPLIPEELKDRFSASATLPILTILANSMLAVTTFSVGVMVTSHRAIGDQTTPRIHRLLMEDTRTQSVLATFIGAFTYALSAIILFRAGYYSPAASVIVFAATVLVVAIVVVSILRWIDHLSALSSLDHALSVAEDRASDTLKTHAELPTLGATPIVDLDEIPAGTKPILASTSGYIRWIDVKPLGEAAKDADAKVFLTRLPGDTVLEGQAMAQVSQGDADLCDSLTEHFAISPNRSPEQDPRYALHVLSESGSKALSPGINDPGTAVEVIIRLERRLWEWSHTSPAEEPVKRSAVYCCALGAAELLETAFNSLMRDGAGQIEVLLRLQSALMTLAEGGSDEMKEAVPDMLKRLEDHGDQALPTEADKDRLRQARKRFSAA